MDKISKVRHTSEEIGRLKTEWRQSGLSKKQFSQERGIKYYTFVSWFDKSSEEEKGFLPVEVSSQPQVFAEIITGKNAIRFYQPVPSEYFLALLK